MYQTEENLNVGDLEDCSVRLSEAGREVFEELGARVESFRRVDLRANES